MTPDSTTPTGPSNLRLRVIWGAIAAAGLFGCTFAGPVPFGLFFAAVQAIMLKEFYRIMRAKGYQASKWIGIIVGLLVFGVLFYFAAYFSTLPGWTVAALGWHTSLGISGASILAGLLLASYLLAIVIGLVTTIILVRAISRWPVNSQPFGSRYPLLAGICYVSIPMALLNTLAFSTQDFTPRRVFLLIFLIWAADTGAYFAGKNLGRRKLAPSISPGKTWEGWAGGALLTLVVGWAAGYFVPDVPLAHRLVAAGVVAVFGPLGDLAESMLKRSAGVKDSGTFLPGHGGLLDRFDAFLLVLPVLALLQALAG